MGRYIHLRGRSVEEEEASDEWEYGLPGADRLVLELYSEEGGALAVSDLAFYYVSPSGYYVLRPSLHLLAARVDWVRELAARAASLLPEWKLAWMAAGAVSHDTARRLYERGESFDSLGELAEALAWAGAVGVLEAPDCKPLRGEEREAAPHDPLAEFLSMLGARFERGFSETHGFCVLVGGRGWVLDRGAVPYLG